MNDGGDYMRIPIGVPEPDPADLGPDRWGADEMATYRLALAIVDRAERYPDLIVSSPPDRGYMLGLVHALRILMNRERDLSEEDEDPGIVMEQTIETARDICFAFTRWVEAGQPRRPDAHVVPRFTPRNTEMGPPDAA